MTAKVVSVINLKGGVGKSTIAMILGEYLAFRKNKRVLLLDLDSQCNLTYAMMKNDHFTHLRNSYKTVYHIFKNALDGRIRPVNNCICDQHLWVSNIARGPIQPTLDMVVAAPDLAQLDVEMLALWESGQPAPNRFNETLKKSLVNILDHYDIVLIDCPPSLSLFTSCAIMASDFFVAPIIPEPLSILGLDLVISRIRELKRRYPEIRIEFKGSILNKVRADRKTHRRVAEQIYGNDANIYMPFKSWIPDAERL
ncbi:MAG: AAA family ATPase, partial [Candidatus Desantisbacteria bacterium]